ncbi:hypothetical protein EDD64_14035, partial [Effusibacillus lacus]
FMLEVLWYTVNALEADRLKPVGLDPAHGN